MSRSTTSETTLPIARLEQLIRATPELVGELRLDSVLQRVADLARELLGAKYAAIGLLKSDSDQLQSFTTSGISRELQERIGSLPVGRGVLGLVIREGKVIRLRDLTKSPASAGFPPHHPPMRSFLGVPVVGRDGIIGDLYLTEKLDAEDFSDDDVHLAVLLASIVASAVESARNYEQATHLLDEVQHLHRSRDRFFAMVNHELRNALAGIYGWAELLVRKKDPQTVPRGAIEILEGAEQAVALLNDLLDLHRLDEDRLRPLLRVVDCCHIVRNAIRTVTPAADEKAVRFAIPEAQSAMCHTDAHRVEQIFVNLFTNAIRHAPKGTTVSIEASLEDGFALLTVRDEGPGVAPDDKERIFDIYHTTADAKDGGHGVGLPLSRRLARLMGGDLYAVATPGHGGVFVLRLPRSAS